MHKYHFWGFSLPFQLWDILTIKELVGLRIVRSRNERINFKINFVTHKISNCLGIHKLTLSLYKSRGLCVYTYVMLYGDTVFLSICFGKWN